MCDSIDQSNLESIGRFVPATFAVFDDAQQ